MRRERMEIGGRSCVLIGDFDAPALLIQPTDEGERALLDSEAAHIRRLAPGRPFLLAAFPVERWNDELSPWPAAPVFGRQGFGGEAADTLRYVAGALLPALAERFPGAGASLRAIGGYSLAGLFALWAACDADLFDAAGGVSPSVWFPGWLDYARAHPIRAGRVYLSLGDTEERTRNPVMARVGDALRATCALMEGAADCTLEWNPGNHFRDADLRTAKGFAHLLK